MGKEDCYLGKSIWLRIFVRLENLSDDNYLHFNKIALSSLEGRTISDSGAQKISAKNIDKTPMHFFELFDSGYSATQSNMRELFLNHRWSSSYGEFIKKDMDVAQIAEFIKNEKASLDIVDSAEVLYSKCLKRIPNSIVNVYKTTKRIGSMMRVHCGQYEQITDDISVELFMGFIAASNKVCGNRTPNGTVNLQVKTTVIKQEARWNPVEKEYLGVTGETIIDKALVGRYRQFRGAMARREIFKFYTSEVLQPLFSTYQSFVEGYESVLSSIECGGNTHRNIQDRILGFLNFAWK